MGRFAEVPHPTARGRSGLLRNCRFPIYATPERKRYNGIAESLAPNYWAGYYAVYVAMTAFLSAVFRDSLRTWPETEALFIAAAIFAVSAGVAPLSAIIAEGVGYVVLLIPRRIKQLKEEGRQEGRAEEREHVGALLARHDRGEITMEQLIAILSDRYNGNGGTD